VASQVVGMMIETFGFLLFGSRDSLFMGGRLGDPRFEKAIVRMYRFSLGS
jgi:hypothetical protein